MKDILKELFKPRTIFAGLFYISFCRLIDKQLPVPDALNNIVLILMGFYFGQKSKKS